MRHPLHARVLGAAIILCAISVNIVAAMAQEKAQGNPADTGKTYDLKAKYTVGDILKYKFAMNMNLDITTPGGQTPFPGGEMVMTSGIRYKTAGIKPDGTAVIVMTTENSKSTMMGQPIPTPPTTTVTMEIDSRGIGKMRASDSAAGAQALAQIMNMNQMPTMGVILPDHPVKVGDSWETEIPFMTGKMKSACTLLGVEQVGEVESLRIKITITMPFDVKMGAAGAPVTEPDKAVMLMTGSAITNNIVNIRPSDARILKMAGDMKAEIKMEMKGEAASKSPFGSEMNMKMGGTTSLNLESAEKVSAAPAPKSSGAAVKPKPKDQ